MKLLVDGRVAEADEIKLMSTTPEGVERVRVLVKSTVTAFSVDNIIAYMGEVGLLKRRPTDEEANDICNVLWSCLYQRKNGELDEYVDQVAARIEACGMVPPMTVQ